MTSPMPRRRRPAARPRNRYRNYLEFYEEELRDCYCRSLDADVAWCPEWRLHPEAVKRVTDLWQAWESALREQSDQGDAMAKWWANLADPIMRELLDPRNTFRGCSLRVGHKPRNGPLPPAAPPAE